MSNPIKIDDQYKNWIIELKQRIRQSQIKAAFKVNEELLRLYWHIGQEIVLLKAESKWGSNIMLQISMDLKEEFPDVGGFSPTNLRYIKRFFLFYQFDSQIPPQAEGKLGNCLFQPQVGGKLEELLFSVPWGHHKLLIDKCKSINDALFYLEKCRENGWSRNVLMNMLETNLYSNQGKAITNFAAQLPTPQSDLAQQMLKDPYNFDFLAMRHGYNERELEDALTHNITKFLLELGSGFAYIGRQVRIEVGEKEFFIDLLFYHLKLRCYIVVELKTGEFKAEFVSKLGLYVAAINHHKKDETDQPTIGLLICKTKDEVVAQYTLESTTHPIGVSEYQLSKLYPRDIEGIIPSIEEIEKEL